MKSFPCTDADDAGRDGTEDERVGEFTDDGRADQPRPQVLFLHALLHHDQNQGVQQLSDKVGGQAGDQESGNDTDDGFEGGLVLVELRRRQLHCNPEARSGKNQCAEAQVDRASGRFEAVDLAEHVTEDVGEREQEESTIGDDGQNLQGTEREVGIRKEGDPLGRRHVRDQQRCGEERDDRRVITPADVRKFGFVGRFVLLILSCHVRHPSTTRRSDASWRPSSCAEHTEGPAVSRGTAGPSVMG